MRLALDRFRLNIGPDIRLSDKLALVERGRIIPKIIHQTNYAKPWPQMMEDNVARMRSMNQDWEYRFYSNNDRRNYILSYYGIEILSYYDKIDPAYGAVQADFFRYLVMYREGGVYLDIKSGTHRPLSETIDQHSQYVLSMWPNRQGGQYDQYGIHEELTRFKKEEYQQWHIICAPGHPFLRNVILYTMRNIRIYNPFIHGTARKAVINVTGPIAYTLAISSLLDVEPHIEAPIADFGIYYSMYDLEGLGSEGHVGGSHYSALIGRPVVKGGAALTAVYKAVRKASGK